MLRISTFYFSMLLILTFFVACAKKPEIEPSLSLKEQVQNKKLSIPFASNNAESKQWYSKYFEPILKDSKVDKNSQVAKDFENFARVYFADLSQIDYENEAIDTHNLAQSVVFTTFAKEFMREYLFIESKHLHISPWADFSSKIQFKENIQSSSFVLKIAESKAKADSNKNPPLHKLQDLSYINFNDAVLGNSLLKISDVYYDSDKLLEKTKEITGLDEYKMPKNLQSLLFYRILYFKYAEKFESNYLLDRFAFLYPQYMISALDSILQRKFSDSEELKRQFRFQNYEPTNPVSIAECKSAKEHYPYKNECVSDIFLAWISYLQREMRENAKDSNISQNSQDSIESKEVLPIYVDSKLCLLVATDSIILYPHNTSSMCAMIYKEKLKEYD